MLFSLNPVAAFNYIIKDASNFETRSTIYCIMFCFIKQWFLVKVLNWLNLFNDSTESFTVSLNLYNV